MTESPYEASHALRRGKFKILGVILAILALIIIIPALMVLPMFWGNPRGDLKVFFHTPLPRSLKVLKVADPRFMAPDGADVYYILALDARDFGTLTRAVQLEKINPASRQEWESLLDPSFFRDLKDELLRQSDSSPGSEPHWPKVHQIEEGKNRSILAIDERTSPALYIYLSARISYPVSDNAD